MSGARQRLDKWLWFARFAKTRTLAAKLVTDGRVRVNGLRAETGAKTVRTGDVLTIAAPHVTVVVRIVAEGVNALRDKSRGFLVITHYQRLLDHIVPDTVHVMSKGRIVKSGGKELALELEKSGYAAYGEAA